MNRHSSITLVAPLRDGIPTPANDSRRRTTVTSLRSTITWVAPLRDGLPTPAPALRASAGVGKPSLAPLPIVLVLVVGCAWVGCGPPAAQVEAPAGDRLAPATLYPMIEGSQWVYDVDTGGGEPPTLGIFEVTESDGARRSIANNRGMSADGQVTYGDPIQYEVSSTGIRHLGSGGWLLRAPVHEGATWEGMGGRTARVTDDDASVEVVAGEYEHCVRVEETGGEDGRTISTVYCPGVGPVVVESRMDSELTTRTVSTRSGLRSYDSGADAEL